MTKGKKLRDFLWVTAGCVIFAVSYSLFLVPCRIAPGGVSGLGMIVNELAGMPVGVATLLLNLPLLAAAVWKLGARFLGMTIYATLLSSLLIDLTAVSVPFTSDLLLVSLYGGVLMGVGLGMVFFGGASTGGTDVLSKLLLRSFPKMKMGQMLLIIDAVVVLLSAAVFRDINRALYAAISLYVSTRIIDGIAYRFDFATTLAYIISENPGEIAGEIMQRMERGVTLLPGRGGYTGQEKEVVLCALKRTELSELERIVSEKDPEAFMIALAAHQVYGDGFSGYGK